MPPRRTRRKSSRKQAWFDQKHSARSLAIKALKNVHYIRGLVNSEMFHHDRNETALAISSTGSVANLVGIAQGDGDGMRTGNSMLLRTHLLRIRFTRNAAATTTIIRYLIVQDTQQVSDTSPTVTDILESADVDSGLKLGTSGRFKVLVSKTVALYADKPIYHYEKYKSLYLHVRYNGSLATDIQKNGIFLLTLSDQAVNTPTMDLMSRIGYHDN